MKKSPDGLDKAGPPGYTENRCGALPRGSQLLLVKSEISKLTARVPSGRSTRFWSKEDGAGDDGDPDDNPDESPLDAFLVHGASPPFAGSEPTAPMYAAAPREPESPRPKDGFILPNFTVFVK